MCPAKLLRGTTVGDYLLTRELGEGASGIVFEGINSRGSHVALKFFTKGPHNTFMHEKKFMEMFFHSNRIIDIIESFSWECFNVIVMEKLTTDLLDFIEDTISISKGKNIFQQLCEGIKKLHDSNVAHRDIKPENILLNDQGCVKIADFGASIRCEGLCAVNGTFGTLFYNAPEIMTQSTYDPKKADIWSLGVVLHVIFTGVWPYVSDNQKSLMQSLSNGTCDVCLYSSYLPNDPHVIQLLTSMLDRDPTKRPTIEDVLQSTWLDTPVPTTEIETIETRMQKPRFVSNKKLSPPKKVAQMIRQFLFRNN